MARVFYCCDIMKLALILGLSFLASMISPCLADDAGSLALPRSTPEKQGISSSAILSFVQAADAQIDAMHRLMLLRHGQVVAEGWRSLCPTGTFPITTRPLL